MAQKQRLVGVRADFEQTYFVNRAIDQWSKHAFVKTKEKHYEQSQFVVSRFVWTDEMFDEMF